jgi:hypothetical protein
MDAPRAYGGAGGQGPGAFPGDNPAYHTIVRHSRRHVGADDDIEVPEADASKRHWSRYAAVVLLVAVAAGAGVGVGIKTSPSAPAAATETFTTPDEQLAYAVRPILSLLSYRTGPYLLTLKEVSTMKGQQVQTNNLRVAFKKAQIALFKLPAKLKAQPAFAGLYKAVTALTVDWNAATIAASTHSVPDYNIARKGISAAETIFATAAARAAGGSYVQVVTKTVAGGTPTPTTASTTTTH